MHCNRTAAALAASVFVLARGAWGEAQSPTGSVHTLALPQVYALAVQRSESLAVSTEEWRAAEARYHQATGGRMPEVLGVGLAEWQDVGGATRADRTVRAGLGARYPIFTGFRTTRAIEGRAAEQEAYGHDLARERQLLYLDVADAFYTALAAQRERIVLDEEVRALEDRVAELERRVPLGRSRRAELLFAQSEVADARVSVAAIRAAGAAADELLAFLIGEPLGDRTLADDTPLPAPPDVARYLEQTEARPDVLAQTARREAADADMRAERSDRGPAVDVAGNVYAYSDPGDSGDWDVVLRAQLPLFDGGLRRAETAERMADLRVSELRLAEVRRSADRDVRTAYAELVGALDQWVALREAERITGESVDVQKKDYELGRATHLDVLGALVRYHGLRRRAVVAEMQARAADVHLHVAAGAVEQP